MRCEAIDVRSSDGSRIVLSNLLRGLWCITGLGSCVCVVVQLACRGGLCLVGCEGCEPDEQNMNIFSYSRWKEIQTLTSPSLALSTNHALCIRESTTDPVIQPATPPTQHPTPLTSKPRPQLRIHPHRRGLCMIQPFSQDSGAVVYGGVLSRRESRLNQSDN